MARLHLAVMVIAILVAAVWAMDHLTTYRDDVVVTEVVGAAPQHDGRARLFLFLVDSLRFEAATDPELMPYLSAQYGSGTCPRGVCAKVISSRDAVTVSAIREMFTGRERFLVFGFLRDFVTGREGMESLFTQLRERKISSAVQPLYAFEQFGADLPPPSDDDVDDRDRAQQDAWARQTLDKFRAGSVDVAVSHIIYSDRVAHDYGVNDERYWEAYGHVDALIREMDQAIDPRDTFIVTGDHGHTDNGRHSLGLDVPSFTFYRGPGFKRGVSLGTIPIRAHRYLMSWAAKVPLSPAYGGPRYPQALMSSTVPVEFQSGSGEVGDTRAPSAVFWLVAAIVGLLGALWLGLVRGVWEAPKSMQAGLWLCVGLCAGITFSMWLPVAALAVGLTLVAREVRGGNGAGLQGRWRRLAYGAAGLAGGLSLHGWGRHLAAIREEIHEPSWVEMERFAFLLIAVCGVVAWRLGAAKASWITIGVVALLFYPTVYRYGAMPSLVTLWLAWIVALLVDASRRPRRDLLVPLVLGVGVFLCIQPFAFADAGNFEFHTWHAWVDALQADGHWEWIEWSLYAKMVIFARWRVPHLLKPLGVFAAFQVHELQWNPWPLSQGGIVALIVMLALVGGLAKHWFSDETGQELRRVTWLAALFIAYYYTIRIPQHHYMWADFFLAGLVLSGMLVRRCARADQLRHHQAILTLFGVVAGAWFTVAWTFHLFEWKVLYEWFSAGFIEENALAFIPIIDGRYLVAVLMVRVLVREAFKDVRYPWREVWSGAGLKLVGSALLITGFAYAFADSDIYLESVQQAAVLMVLSLALI